MSVLSTINIVWWFYSEAAQLQTIIKVISVVSGEEEGTLTSFSIFTGWSLATFLSLEYPRGSYYEVNMLMYYLTCLVIIVCSILELQHQHSKNMKNANQKKTKTYKRKRWRKKNPFRQKDGCLHRRAQRRKRLLLLEQASKPGAQEDSLLRELWRDQINWYSIEDYLDLDHDGWLSNSNYSVSSSRYLHLHNMAAEFDSICSINPCLVDLFLGKEGYFSLRKENGHRLLDLVFVSDNKAVDLTSLTSTNSIFRFQSMYHVTSDDGHPIVFDTGASISISPHKEDFLNLDCSVSASNAIKVKGLDSESHVKGVGTIRLRVHTDQGYQRTIETTAYFIPTARISLLSVCRYQYEHPKQGCKFVLTGDEFTFTFLSSAGGGDISFDVQDSNFIPVTSSFTQQILKQASLKHQRTFMVLEEANTNLSRSQKAVLKLHFRLGHFNLPWIQS